MPCHQTSKQKICGRFESIFDIKKYQYALLLYIAYKELYNSQRVSNGQFKKTLKIALIIFKGSHKSRNKRDPYHIYHTTETWNPMNT